MKRWLLILLVLLMPLQYGWAAVGAYCLDEHTVVVPTEEAGQEQASEDAHQEDGKQTCELGCSHCHGHVLSLPAGAAPVLLLSSGGRPRLETSLPDLHALQPRPERPQWTQLA